MYGNQKDQLRESLKEHLLCDKFDIGYIEAGRQGIWGKMRWNFRGHWWYVRIIQVCWQNRNSTRGKASYMTVYLASDLSHQVSNDSKFKVHLNYKNCTCALESLPTWDKAASIFARQKQLAIFCSLHCSIIGHPGTSPQTRNAPFTSSELRRTLEEVYMDFSISGLLGSSSLQNHTVQDQAGRSSTGDKRSGHLSLQSTGTLPTSPFMCWISQGMHISCVSLSLIRSNAGG